MAVTYGMAENFSEMVKAAHRIKPAKWQDAVVRELVGHVRAAGIPDAEAARVFEDAIVADVAAQVAKVNRKPVGLGPVAPALEVNGIKIVADPLVPRGSLEFRAHGNQFLHPADYANLKAELEKRAKFAAAVEKAWGPPAEKPPLWGLVPKAAESYREDMVSTIIAEQVSRGGVDTEGTRAQAERWCAMLCGCVCEGMRATTDDSAYRLAKHEALGYRVAPGGRAAGALFRGKPLGRP